jgi:uncharacterized protein
VSVPEFTAPAPLESRPVEYASFGRRLGAALMDSAVWILGIAFFNPFVFVGDNETAGLLVSLVILSAWFNYFAFCEWRWGQTIGKNAFGIRVLPLEGGALSWQAAALRNLLRLVDLPLALIGADYVIVRRSPRHQRLGDRAAKTIVVRERAEHEAAARPAAALDPAAAPDPPAGAARPTAAEIFGDAAEALGRHPAAGAEKPAERDEDSAAPQVKPPDQSEIASRVTWSPWRAVGGVLVALLAAVVLTLPIAIADPNIGTDDASVAANVLAQLIQTATLIAVPIAVAMRSGADTTLRGALDRLGVRRFAPSAFGWMGVAVVAYLVVASISYVLINPHQRDIASDFGPLPLQILLIVIAAPVSEELSFRGFLFGGLRTRLPAIGAALLSGVLFGALHAPGGIGTVPQLFVFGAILALLYEKTGSILPGMILHVLNNTVGLLGS